MKGKRCNISFPNKYIFGIVAIILLATYYLLLWFDVPVIRHLKILIEAIVLLFLTLYLILRFWKELCDLWEGFTDRSLPFKRQIRALLEFLAIHLLIVACLAIISILNHVWPKLERILPLYNPAPKEMKILSPEVTKPPTYLPMLISQIRAYIALGRFEDNDSGEIESTTVYATIMVDGLNEEAQAIGRIEWGDGAQEEFPVRNGTKYIRHSYGSTGSKRVRFTMRVDGILQIIDSTGIPRKVIEKEINITGGVL